MCYSYEKNMLLIRKDNQEPISVQKQFQIVQSFRIVCLQAY